MSGTGEPIDSKSMMASSSSTFNSNSNSNSNTSSNSLQPPAKRKRLKPSFSCLPCRTKKTKCDRQKPVCGKCAKAGFDETLCLYQSGNSWTNITVVESVGNNIRDPKLNTSIQDSSPQMIHTHSPFPSLPISSSPAPILSDIRSTTPSINDIGRQQQIQQQQQQQHQIQGIRLVVPDVTNSDISSSTTTDRTISATATPVNINNGGVHLQKPMSVGTNSPNINIQFQNSNRTSANTSNNVTPVNDTPNSNPNSSANINTNSIANTNTNSNTNSYKDAFNALNSELNELKSVVESLDNVLKAKISISNTTPINQEIEFNNSQINNEQLPNQDINKITKTTAEINGDPTLYALSKGPLNVTTEETPLNNNNTQKNSRINNVNNGDRSDSHNSQASNKSDKDKEFLIKNNLLEYQDSLNMTISALNCNSIMNKRTRVSYLGTLSSRSIMITENSCFLVWSPLSKFIEIERKRWKHLRKLKKLASLDVLKDQFNEISTNQLEQFQYEIEFLKLDFNETKELIRFFKNELLNVFTYVMPSQLFDYFDLYFRRSDSNKNFVKFVPPENLNDYVQVSLLLLCIQLADLLKNDYNLENVNKRHKFKKLASLGQKALSFSHFFDKPNVISVQCLLAIRDIICQDGYESHGADSSNLLSIFELVLQCSYKVGIHRDPDSYKVFYKNYKKDFPITKNIWRCIWFNVCIFDTFLSKSLGLPPLINEKYCDCKLPQGEAAQSIGKFNKSIRGICKTLCSAIKPLTLLEYLKEVSKLFELFNSDGNTSILELLKPREGVTKTEAENIVYQLFLELEIIYLLTTTSLHLRVAIKNIETLKNDGNKIDENALKLLKRVSIVFVEISNLGAILTFLIFKNFLNGNTVFKNFPVLNRFLINNSSRGLFSANMALFIHLIEEFSENKNNEKILLKKSSSDNNNSTNDDKNAPGASKNTATNTPTTGSTNNNNNTGIAISPANVSITSNSHSGTPVEAATSVTTGNNTPSSGDKIKLYPQQQQQQPSSSMNKINSTTSIHSTNSSNTEPILYNFNSTKNSNLNKQTESTQFASNNISDYIDPDIKYEDFNLNFSPESEIEFERQFRNLTLKDITNPNKIFKRLNPRDVFSFICRCFVDITNKSLIAEDYSYFLTYKLVLILCSFIDEYRQRKGETIEDLNDVIRNTNDNLEKAMEAGKVKPDEFQRFLNKADDSKLYDWLVKDVDFENFSNVFDMLTNFAANDDLNENQDLLFDPNFISDEMPIVRDQELLYYNNPTN
ncbi:hypothetical protein B5S29_g4037 [[Candida] boidinii]|nr:hypothetical protein B5S29_g4037 [[Candida] boidinii]